MLRAALAVFLLLAPAPRRPELDPCPPVGAEVVVDTRRRGLWLCESGHAVDRFPVAIGRGGPGKRRRGDLRTPLGEYPLGPPRPSRRYGLFIPVGYPTPEQLRLGYTGTAVGIHGPERLARWLGGLNTFWDWTAGCVVVGSDAEIGRIAGWVASRAPARVRIR
jgi:hypothetical protein